MKTFYKQFSMGYQIKRETRARAVEENPPCKKSRKHRGKRRASAQSESSEKKAMKWSWTVEVVEVLLKYVKTKKQNVSSMV